jgi:hypothetical protein
MKAEHRHQLHTNVLADRMGRLLQGMKSAPRSTSTLVWVFIVLIFATFVVWQYAASSLGRDRSALWTSLDQATHDPGNGPGRLQALETVNPGTIAARAAAFQLARWKLQQGLGLIATDDRARAVPLLEEARVLYGKLVDQCTTDPLLAQEAMMGRATAEESLAIQPAATQETQVDGKSEEAKGEEHGGSLNKALEYYRELAKKYPDSILGKKADERAKELEQPASRSKFEQFYAAVNKKDIPKANTPVTK